MKKFKFTLALCAVSLMGIMEAQVAPAPQDLTQVKTKTEAAAATATGAKPRVLHAGFHRRAGSVDTGTAFVKAALAAARASGADIVKFRALSTFLDDLKVSVNSQDQEGGTALHAVAFAGGPQSLRVIKYLLDRPEIDMNLPNNNARTALMESMRNNQRDAFNMLVEHAKNKMTAEAVIEAMDYAKDDRKHFKKRLNKLLKTVSERGSQVMRASLVFTLKKETEQEKEDRIDTEDLMGEPGECCGCFGSATKSSVTKYVP